MKYTVDHWTGLYLVDLDGVIVGPELAGRNYSNHRTLSGARRSTARLSRLDPRGNYVVVDNTTGQIVEQP